MVIPIHLLLEIVKYTKYNDLRAIILINVGIYINRDYLARLKIKEIGLKGGNIEIYLKTISYLIKNKIVDYYKIFVFSTNLSVVKFLVDKGANIDSIDLEYCNKIVKNYIQQLKN